MQSEMASQIIPTRLRKVLLAGAGGITGVAYRRLLQAHDISVIALDKKELVFDNSEKNIQYLSWEPDLTWADLPGDLDAITLTPGVPLSNKLFADAKEHGVPIFTELEYGYNYLADEKLLLVTGTDGKSTTSSLLHSLLPGSWLGGNFGTPLSQYILDKNHHDIMILELSSYQLERLRNMRSHCSLLLNIAPDHLDRYSDFESYAKVKLSILDKCETPNNVFFQDLLIEQFPDDLRNFSKSQIVDTKKLSSKNYFIKENYLCDRHGESLDLRNTSIQGDHNYGNLLFAIEAASLLLSSHTLSTHTKNLVEFKPLAHRYEKVGEDEAGNIYINDSKATTCQSAIQAVSSTSGQVFWLIGGSQKGEDYNSLALHISNDVQAYLFGPAARELADQNKAFQNAYSDLENAFLAIQTIIKEKQVKNATVLMSPAMASFDSYPNYQKRGEHFRELVKQKLDSKP